MIVLRRSMSQSIPPRRPASNPLYKPVVIKPRKVTGGVRLAPTLPPFDWAGQRWMRVAEASAAPAAQAQGLEYARLAQTRRIDVVPGKVIACVQGRAVRAYDTTILVQPFTSEQQEQLVAILCDQAVHAAKLLAGELPVNIEEVLTPAGLRLFPSDAGEFKIQCTCREHEIKPWCHHAVCAALLVAERFSGDAFLMFTLRGLVKDDLMERLRQRRALLGQALGSALVYSPPVAGVSDRVAASLQESIADYWESSEQVLEAPRIDAQGAQDAGGLDLPIVPPPISHPLLRRLGPSPFTPPTGTARFPLVGLLATCYDLISQSAIQEAAEPERQPESESPSQEMGTAPEPDEST
jgi:uncharacterized Zn finger protein